MIICVNCGHDHGEERLICEACGHALDEALAVSPDVERTLAMPPHSEPDGGEAGAAEAEEMLNYAAELLGEGRAQEAADTCRHVLELDPESLSAYSLLAMAEEELGNWHLAIEAYEGVLQLDPDRVVERDKIGRLHARMRAHPVEEEAPAEQQIERAETLRRVAPVILGAATFVLIFLVALLLILHGRSTRTLSEAEQTFQTQLAQGEAAGRQGDFQSAALWFQQALVTKPGDETANQWLVWAQQQTQSRAAYDRWNYETMGGKWAGARNIFAPIPIAPTTASAGSGQFLAPSPIAPPPSVDDVWTPPVSAGRDAGGTHASGSGPFPNPTPSGGTTTTTTTTTTPPPPAQPVTPAAGPPATVPPAQAAERPRSVVNVAVSGNSRSAGAGAAQSGDALRGRADSLRASGNSAGALAAYQQAIDAYRREISQSPATAGAKRSAIDTCSRAMDLLRAGQGGSSGSAQG